MAAGNDFVQQAVARMDAGATVVSLLLTQIGDSGAEELAQALAKNKTVETLHLYDNGIGDSGASALAGALARNDTLKILDLGLNRIGDAGAEALSNALTRNKSLRVLHLGSNHISDKGVTFLLDAMTKNTSLVTLYLGANDDIEHEESVKEIDLLLLKNASARRGSAWLVTMTTAFVSCWESRPAWLLAESEGEKMAARTALVAGPQELQH